MRKPTSVLENETHKSLLECSDHSISSRRLNLVCINKVIKLFTLSVDYREKIHESGNTGKYLDLAKQLKNRTYILWWNILSSTHWKSFPGFEKKRLEELSIRGRIETVNTTTLIRSGKILRIPRDIKRFAVSQTSLKTRMKNRVGIMMK